MKGLTKKRGEKFDLILEAAIKVFAEKGFAYARVSDVAKGAGVADGTIYLYFNSKEDILISLVEEKMTLFVYSLAKDLSKEEDYFQKLRKIVGTHLAFLGGDRDLAMVTQIEMRQSDSGIRLALSEPIRRYFRLIEEVVREGQSKGDFASDIDPSLLRKMIFGTLDEVITRWVLAQRNADLKEMVEPVFAMLEKVLKP